MEKLQNDSFHPKKAFTLVEMMVVAPIVIIVIGVCMTVIVSMTGQVLTTRGSNYLTLSINDALDKIDRDVKDSSSFLATNNINLATAGTQGYGDDTSSTNTTAFFSVDAVKGDMLILNNYATTQNPLKKTRGYVYIPSSYSCVSAYISQNPKMATNIVYFVKNNVLWRRVIMPSNYTSAGCSTPWQIPSCNASNTHAFCKTTDMMLIEGVSATGFSLDYFTSTNNVTPIADPSSQASLTSAVSVEATITATKNIAGRNISQTGSLFVSRI